MSNVVQFPGNRLPKSEDFLIEVGKDEEIKKWGCMDDRNPDTHDQVLGEELYRQLVGGAFGFGLTFSVALEARRRGAFVERNQPVHRMGKLVTTLAARNGIQLVNHAGCAGHDASAKVAGTVLENPEATYREALLAKPNLTEVRFQAIVNGIGNIAQNGLLLPPEVSSEQMRRHDDFPAIPVAQLSDRHTGAEILMNYRPYTLFDIRGARAAGVPAYHMNLGDIPEVTAATRDILPVHADYIQDVTAVLAGAIRAGNHLLSPEQQPLQIRLLEAA